MTLLVKAPYIELLGLMGANKKLLPKTTFLSSDKINMAKVRAKQFLFFIYLFQSTWPD